MSQPTTDAVIAAAGSGARLGAETAKAFVEVGGAPLFQYALDRATALGVRITVVTVPPEAVDRYSAEVTKLAEDARADRQLRF